MPEGAPVLAIGDGAKADAPSAGRWRRGCSGPPPRAAMRRRGCRKRARRGRRAARADAAGCRRGRRGRAACRSAWLSCSSMGVRRRRRRVIRPGEPLDRQLPGCVQVQPRSPQGPPPQTATPAACGRGPGRELSAMRARRRDILAFTTATLLARGAAGAGRASSDQGRPDPPDDRAVPVHRPPGRGGGAPLPARAQRRRVGRPADRGGAEGRRRGRRRHPPPGAGAGGEREGALPRRASA